ncbi:response regulator transcription factor [Olivibacter sp. SDN3]|uniref:LytR/AlgR family response regulator transcription factor n=1 Tax=Olivibacter sp. SDN3 TaxID=2764720 RepID=UPI001651136A|nr:LytTR family DNA-binding domain-containing protein [Olivibacter sp. SDN3]QNL49042.1 response regulator transcription factor [Olivibacter sp. SDN3]
MENLNRIRCMAVDDEPPALQLLKSYIDKIHSLQLIFHSSNALDAFNFIQQNEIDLLFIDIQMPGLNGLEFVKALFHKPAIIITTAYREHAAEGFDLDVLDYLVKPFRFERFLKAVSKYTHTVTVPANFEMLQNNRTSESVYMYFNVNKELIKVFLKDILYIESIKDYIKIVTLQKTIVTYQRISYMEEKLPEEDFMRTHKSFIVNIHKINSFKSDRIRIASDVIPIGRFYKRNLIDRLNGDTFSE